MPRTVLAADRLHPAIADKVGLPQKSTLAEVQAAIAAHDVVVVGMAMNPHPGQARRALVKAGGKGAIQHAHTRRFLTHQRRHIALRDRAERTG